MMKRKIIFCLIESAEISSDSDTSISNISELSDLLENNSWTDEDALYFPLIKILMFGVRKTRVQNYLVIIESWTDSEFKEHLRLSRRTAYQLIHEIEQSPFIPHHSFGIKPISGKLSFFIFLWFMANTEPLRTVADRFNVSILSVFRVIRQVIKWILTKIDIIKWPEGDHISCAITFF